MEEEVKNKNERVGTKNNDAKVQRHTEKPDCWIKVSDILIASSFTSSAHEELNKVSTKQAAHAPESCKMLTLYHRQYKYKTAPRSAAAACIRISCTVLLVCVSLSCHDLRVLSCLLRSVAVLLHSRSRYHR
jgi:hypothetical protein